MDHLQCLENHSLIKIQLNDNVPSIIAIDYLNSHGGYRYFYEDEKKKVLYVQMVSFIYIVYIIKFVYMFLIKI